jgi:hypothetical protein
MVEFINRHDFCLCWCCGCYDGGRGVVGASDFIAVECASRHKQSVTVGQGNFLSPGDRIAPPRSQGNSVIDEMLKDF